MSSTDQLSSLEATQSEGNPSPQPGPSPSVAGIEYELKDLALADEDNIVKYPPSLYTDSTLSAHTASNQELRTKIESMSWITHAPESSQGGGLTYWALRAHDLSTREHGYARDLAGWCRGNIFERDDLHKEVTDSLLVNKPTGSETSSYLNSSSDSPGLSDIIDRSNSVTDTDRDVSGAGAIFHDATFQQMDDEAILYPRDTDFDSRLMKENGNSQSTTSRVLGDNPNQPEMAIQVKPLAELVRRVMEGAKQLGAIIQRGPPNLEYGYPDLPEEEATKLRHHPWITAAWYWLAAVLDPPPEAAYRATYICGCGELCYIDVEDVVPGGAAELEADIRKKAALIRSRNPDGHSPSRDNIQTPARVHFSASRLSRNGEQGTPIQPLPTSSQQSQGRNVTDALSQEQSVEIEAVAQKYLLLCVNTKHGLVKLVHIDVSDHRNDQFLFQEIRNEYMIARQGHDWNVATLFPPGNLIPRLILNLISMISLPNLGIYQLIAGTFQDCRIFVPRKIEFIKFELMPVRLEIYAGHIEKPEIPSTDEVQVKKTYEYEPITLKAKILNVPIHELLKPGVHLNRYWWKRFPKKLHSPLTFDEDLDCCGWGILITEGWNRPFVLFVCLLSMMSFAIFVALYSICTHDGSTGAGKGEKMCKHEKSSLTPSSEERERARVAALTGGESTENCTIKCCCSENLSGGFALSLMVEENDLDM
ncbi:hypothetical protein G7054_g12904 [Neopestalotiopsis clavispora]|nr:hypothetical protein G7054_g12904 [Neopestalotiopsis clavispora]